MQPPHLSQLLRLNHTLNALSLLALDGKDAAPASYDISAFCAFSQMAVLEISVRITPVLCRQCLSRFRLVLLVCCMVHGIISLRRWLVKQVRRAARVISER